MNTEKDRLMTQADIRRIYNLSEYMANKIFLQPDFPSFLIGTKLNVWESEMQAWFKGQIKVFKARKGGK